MTSCVLLPAAQHQPPSLSLDVDWVLSAWERTGCTSIFGSEDGDGVVPVIVQGPAHDAPCTGVYGSHPPPFPTSFPPPMQCGMPHPPSNMYAPHQLVQFPFGPGHLYQPQAMLTAWPHHVLVQSVTEAALEPGKSTTPAGHWQLSSRTQQQATSGGPCQSSCSEAGVVPEAQQEASGRQLPSAPHANQEPAWLPRAAPLSLPAQPLSSSAAARSNHVQQPTAKLLQARSSELASLPACNPLSSLPYTASAPASAPLLRSLSCCLTGAGRGGRHEALPGRHGGANTIASRQEALQRYRLKKASRLYTKKIRYTLRKVNADRRPRIKGRFVKKSEPGQLYGPLLAEEGTGSDTSQVLEEDMELELGQPSCGLAAPRLSLDCDSLDLEVGASLLGPGTLFDEEQEEEEGALGAEAADLHSCMFLSHGEGLSLTLDGSELCCL
ncbi:CCT motif-domain-containing protein [Haematococcus lacustris]